MQHWQAFSSRENRGFPHKNMVAVTRYHMMMVNNELERMQKEAPLANSKGFKSSTTVLQALIAWFFYFEVLVFIWKMCWTEDIYCHSNATHSQQGFLHVPWMKREKPHTPQLVQLIIQQDASLLYQSFQQEGYDIV